MFDVGGSSGNTSNSLTKVKMVIPENNKRNYYFFYCHNLVGNREAVFLDRISLKLSIGIKSFIFWLGLLWSSDQASHVNLNNPQETFFSHRKQFTQFKYQEMSWGELKWVTRSLDCCMNNRLNEKDSCIKRDVVIAVGPGTIATEILNYSNIFNQI